MTKSNLTVQLDDGVIRKAKILAAKRGTSVSALVAAQVEELTAADRRYEEAKHRALAALDDATDHGGRSWSRAELYER